MATPNVFGRLHVVPRLPPFLERYGEVSVELIMGDSFTDLVEQGIDLALRVGEISDPSLIARRIGVVRRVTVASPAYVKRFGMPKAPAELVDHQCIVYTRLSTGSRWLFESAEGEISVEVLGRCSSDSSEGVRAAVMAGLGIAVIPSFAFLQEIASGEVVVLLRDFEPKKLPLCAIYPSRRYVPLKVRAMIDYLADEFELDPWLSDHAI